MRIATIAVCGWLAGCRAPAPPPTTATAGSSVAVVPSPVADSGPPAREGVKVQRNVPRSLGDGRQLVIEDIVVERIEASPDGAYPAGSGVTVTVNAAGYRGTMSWMSAPNSASAVVWLSTFRIEMTRADPDAAYLIVDRVTDRVLASQAVTIRKGQSLRLHDRVELAFQSHSHKSISEGMESPLMVNVQYDKTTEETHHLYPPRESTWTWQDLRFTLGKYQYNDYMELIVDRLALEPVTLGG